MDARISQVAEQLLLIEKELRSLNLWAETAPSDEALNSGVPFGVGVIEFEQWLQWVFLARMKTLIESGAPLPAVSGIAPMAEEYYRHDAPRFAALTKLLAQIDQTLSL